MGAHGAKRLLMCGVAVLLVVCMLVRPVGAVQVPFTNCLKESVKTGTPKQLQWEPLYADARFDTANSSHRLTVTVWGNVTGSYRNVVLPPPDSPDWADPAKTDGKILEDPLPPDAPKRFFTTLRSQVDVLTYLAWDQNTNFCNSSLTNASCPLAPVFNLTGRRAAPAPYGLPSFNMTNDFSSSYAFTSFAPSFSLLYGDDVATQIGCVSTVVTPDLGGITWALTFIPLVILLVAGFATAFAAVWSPWGTADVFHWTSNHSRDDDLLRLVTPGFADCLQYVQFAVLTGALNLNYPGFFQPIVSQAAWSTLLFNQSFVYHAAPWQSLVDGVYVTNGTYGLTTMAQLVGLSQVGDIWAGMMVWLTVIVAGVFVLAEIGFLIQWLYRYVNDATEEDLRAKNLPFSVGNVVRIVFNYFLLPLVSFSTFQLVVAGSSEAYTVALAVIVLVVLVAFSGWVFYLINSTKPRAVLFDDLPTLLLYGPLYNTYSDDAAAFALVPAFINFMRGVAVGAVQPAGIGQVVLLAICEIIHVLLLHAFRPFPRHTSMNLYHTVLSLLRLVVILLMVAFIPSLGVGEGPKGWIGYAVLLIHAGVLVLGFFLNALQKIAEVVARRLGAGGEDNHGLTRGGLSKIFGMRQLSRRMSRQGAHHQYHRGNPHNLRSSQLSGASAMLSAEDVAAAKQAGFVVVPTVGRDRSESAGSFGVLVGGGATSPAMNNNRQHRSSSALDSRPSGDMAYAGAAGVAGAVVGLGATPTSQQRNVFDSAASSFAPTTPGEASNFSFIPSPGNQQQPTASRPPLLQQGDSAADSPYYRAPRKRRPTGEGAVGPAVVVGAVGAAVGAAAAAGDKSTRRSWNSADWSNRRSSGGAGPAPGAATSVVSGHSSTAEQAPPVAAAAGDVGGVGAGAGVSAAATPPPPPQLQPQPQPAVELEDRQSMPPGLYGQAPMHLPMRNDYATREVDFYYGVRGSALNPDNPGRKFATGPADPTGPMASAAGWLKTLLSGGKSKEKGKGFEVVRSARMPPAMKAAAVDFGPEEQPPEGIPVAMGVLRNGPIDSDDEDSGGGGRGGGRRHHHPGPGELLDADGNPRDDDADSAPPSRVSDLPPMLPGIDAGEAIRLPSRIQSRASRNNSASGRRRQRSADEEEGGGEGAGMVVTTTDAGGSTRRKAGTPKPDIPRKSSRRHSGFLGLGHGKVPSYTVVPQQQLPQQMPPPPQQQQMPPQQGGYAFFSPAAGPSAWYAPLQPQQYQQHPGGGGGGGGPQQQYPSYPYPYPQQQAPPQQQQQQQRSRLPFERTNSQKRVSTGSQATVDDFSQLDEQLLRQAPSGGSSGGGGGGGPIMRSVPGGVGGSVVPVQQSGGGSLHRPTATGQAAAGGGDRPTGYGFVHQGSISRVDPDSRQMEMLAKGGTAAEVVDLGGAGAAKSGR